MLGHNNIAGAGGGCWVLGRKEPGVVSLGCVGVTPTVGREGGEENVAPSSGRLFLRDMGGGGRGGAACFVPSSVRRSAREMDHRVCCCVPENAAAASGWHRAF